MSKLSEKQNKDAQAAIDQSSANAQYSPTTIPFHTHNGVDSPLITTTGQNIGVSSIIQGTNITISPVGGTGDVTVNSAVTDATLPVSNITTNNVSTSAHGFAPILPNNASVYLDGTGAYSTPATSTAIKFGGTGADGALSISSGTTTLNLGNAALFVKNYSSISITGTAALAFSNPNTNGTIVILKSTGNVTVTSSATRAVDLRNIGGTGGAGPLGGAGGNYGLSYGPWLGTTQVDAIPGTGNTGAQAGGGGGGASAVANGSAGTSGGSQAGGAGGTINPAYSTVQAPYAKAQVIPGGGAASGGSGNLGAIGNQAPSGGGALYIECGGNLNITGTFDASGGNGQAAQNSQYAANGGGGGGSIVILYNGSLTANSATFTVTGGTGGANGTGMGAGGAGANGYSYVGANTELA